ncbi:DUF6701 domain-containing protein [Rheinheimera baltica]|uniref:DUF6701 domain-containing protein n=1 Tax=Rheinheimera baltica TaxID=67576 RepID=UPI00273F97EB|nr:DUF6701 domain-containing protein [Rheinheimera baltica]MDP5188491.1 hypothetical protein [Rheinheimera baltica]
MRSVYLLAALFFSNMALAVTYNLSLGRFPPCSTNWNTSGSTYNCNGNGRVTLNSGDIVIANAGSAISANNGFLLNGAQIGTSANRINLLSNYGSIISTNSNTLWGDIQANSSAITLNNFSVNGSITTSGSVSLTGGAITGLVTSSSNTITTNNTNLLGGATARSGMAFSGGTLSGAFTQTSNNTMSLTNVIMTSGTLVGSSSTTISNSVIGSATSLVTVSSNSGAISVTNNSVVYAVLTAPNYSTVNVLSGSQVYGQCLPNSTPADACQPVPVAHYALDLCTAVNNGVIDDLMGTYPATGFNVASQLDGQVLEAAGLTAAGGDYISVPAAVLNNRANFTLSLWFNLTAGSGFRELFSASSNSSDTEVELYINSSNEVRAGLKGNYYSFAGGSSSVVVNNNSWTQAHLVRNGDQLCLYLNGNLVRCVTASATNLNVTRSAIGIWWQANGNTADDFRGDIDEVLIFNQALSDVQIQQMYQNQLAGNSYDGRARTSLCTACLADDFSAANLADTWVTARSNGSFTPSVVNSRLRMTQAVANQATSATYQRLYPAANNLVVVEFDYWAYGGSSADGLAVVLSDASITPQPGAFGGALGYGYKPGIPGFAGGWLGFGLDEFGNFSNEGGVGSIGRRRQSVVIRGSGSENSGYRYLRGTCNNGTTNTGGACLSPAVDGNQNTPHRYRFTIDSRTAGTTLVSVERNTGSGFVTLIAPFNAQNQTGQAPVPENFFLSLTGSTGGSTNIHELDNLSICALRSLPVGQQIDHFEFDYTGQALTCKPETFTVRACKNASCSELVTEPVTASLSPVNSANVNWQGGNVLNFSGGQTTVALRRTVVGSTTIGVSSSVPNTRPLSQTLCRAGAGALSTQACSITFADSGLIFDAPDGIANLPVQNILLSAVRKDNVSQQCVPEFANVTRNVAFWSDYISPGATGRPASLAVSVNGTNAGLTEASRVNVPLNFNAAGQATIAVNYADAGLVQLNARYSGAVSSNDSGLVMNGADQFVRRPQGMCIATGGECAAGDASCGVFRQAGEPFMLQVTAHRYEAGSADHCLNPVTPNFSQNNLSLSHTLVAPSAGVVGTLLTSQYNHSASLNGQSLVSQAVSEVGVFRFNTPAFNYLGMTDPVPNASSLPTGRFIPASFSVNAGVATAACGSFTYFAQPSFSTAFTLEAKNSDGQITQNYQGDFARLNVQTWTSASASSGVRYSAPDLPSGAELSVGAIAPIGTWQLGSAQVVATHQASRPDALVAPLALNVFAAPIDTDAVTSVGLQTLTSNTTVLRYGRLVIENAAGPEEERLPLTFRTQYWDGSQFQTNLADNCTVLNSTAGLLTTTPSSPGLSLAGSGGMVLQGQLPPQRLWLNPSGSPGNWQVEYETSPWLQYYWRGTVEDVQQNPSAEVMFGRFRGNPRQISWRELFQ